MSNRSMAHLPTAAATATTTASTVATAAVATATTTTTVAGHLNETWVDLLLGLSEDVDEITSLLLVWKVDLAIVIEV